MATGYAASDAEDRVPHGPEPCSIFVSTRTGQMRNELGFIGQYGPVHPRALIMTPKRDRQLRLNLVDMAKGSVFEDFEVIIFPNLPTSPRGTLRKVRIYDAMREGVRVLVGQAAHVDLYLHHANRYYAYFERIFAELGIASYTLNMVEEGLATYRWGCPGYEDISSEAKLYLPSEAALRVVRQVRYFCKHVLGLVTCTLRFVERIAEFVLALLCKLTGRNLFDGMATLLNDLMPPKYRFGVVPRFSRGYFCFPEKMRTTRAIAIDELRPLAFATKGDGEEEPLQQVSCVFASQRYGEPALYYEVVLAVLEEMGIGEVCFKLHPREDYDRVAEFLSAAQEAHPSVRVVHDKRLDATPVEDMVADGRCTLLVGLTTSALMYAPLANPDVRIVSFADRFYELYCQLDPSGLAGQGMDLYAFREDLRIFHVVAPEVVQFDPECPSAWRAGAPAAPDAPAGAPAGPGPQPPSSASTPQQAHQEKGSRT